MDAPAYGTYPQAERDLADVERLGYADLPVCIAKTPNSLSDDPTMRGRPGEFEATVRAVQINAGAGFLVVLTGDILRMPGLSRRPLAERISVEKRADRRTRVMPRGSGIR